MDSLHHGHLPIVDSEMDDWRHLPFLGSMRDQPYMTMQLLKLMQLNFRKHLSEKTKGIRLKTGRGQKEESSRYQHLHLSTGTHSRASNGSHITSSIPYSRSYNYRDILIYNGFFSNLLVILHGVFCRHCGFTRSYQNRQALTDRRSIFYSY